VGRKLSQQEQSGERAGEKTIERSRYGAVRGLNRLLKFRSKVMLLELCNALDLNDFQFSMT